MKEAEEAYGSHGAFGEPTLCYELNVEKFAELLILECSKVCSEQRDPSNLNYKPSIHFATAIKKHFGLN
jgi:hypothetical protein